MPNTPSVTSSVKKRNFLSKALSLGKKERAPYASVSSSVVQRPTPPPRQDRPHQREVTPAEGKAESQAADQQSDQVERATEETTRQQIQQISTAVTATPTRPQRDSTNKGKALDPVSEDVEYSLSTTGAYAKLVQHEQTNGFSPFMTGQYSWYTPNCISLFTNLIEMERAMDSNIHMEWSQKKFMSIPCRLYYSVLYYVRILQIKEMAHENSPAISTWLRKFFREFPTESLPIAGPLVPIFANLAGYDPKSDQLSLLLPTLPSDVGTLITTAVDTAATPQPTGWNLTQPNVAALFDIFKVYCSATAPTNATNNLDGDYVPFKIANGGVLSGYTIAAASTTQRARWMLRNPAIDTPVPETYLRFAEHHRRWRNSKFGNTTPARSAAGANYDSLPAFLRLDDQMSWFSECVSMAVEQAKFHSDASNFKKLDWIGTPAVGIFANIIINKGSRPNINSVAWYQPLRETAVAKLELWEHGINPVPKFIAKHALTNAKITIQYNTGGTTPADKEVECLAGPSYRYGPWYGHDADGETEGFKNLLVYSEDSRDEMTVLDRRDLYIHQHFYLAEGK